MYRKATGKILWLNEQTRPDLSYDSLLLSYQNKSAKVKDINEANKDVKKAKATECFVKFGRIGSFEDLKILAYTDASYLNMENKTRSTSGEIIFLSNKKKRLLFPL